MNELFSVTFLSRDIFLRQGQTYEVGMIGSRIILLDESGRLVTMVIGDRPPRIGFHLVVIK